MSTTMAKPAVRLTDSTLRDGSHAVRHQFTEQDVIEVAGALDAAGLQVIEVTHGDGLAGSSFNYGFGARTDVQLVEAAVKTVKRAKIAVLVLPGSAPSMTCAQCTASVPGSPGWRPTAPRRTSRSSTSGRPASSAWRRSDS